MLRGFSQGAKSFNYLKSFVRPYSISSDFEEAQQKFKASRYSEEPYEPVSLKLYGLCQQAHLGDVAGEEPPRDDILKHRKFEAWKQFKGLSNNDAQREYIALVDTLFKDGKPLEYMNKLDDEYTSVGEEALKNPIPLPKKPEHSHETLAH